MVSKAFRQMVVQPTHQCNDQEHGSQPIMRENLSSIQAGPKQLGRREDLF
jgi:hypothetical protein